MTAVQDGSTFVDAHRWVLHRCAEGCRVGVGRDGAMMVTIAEEFTTAYAAVGTADVARPELLPVRLARACARVLPAAGVGISLFGSNGIRVPVGASDDDAAIAERLQFTAAEGPCLDGTRWPGRCWPPRR